MANQTRIQLRRGYSTGYTGPMIGGVPTGVSGTWVDQTLAPGEIGFELNTGKFKIGTNGATTWSSLPYAGGSLLSPGSGISLVKDDASNTYTLYSTILSSGNGLTASTGVLAGNGTTTASGSYYSISLSDRLQNLSNISTTGIIVATGLSGAVTRSLDSGNNIFISNANGSSGNPTISLSSSLTGITNISGINNFTIGSNSGINITAGSGTVAIDDLTVTELNVGGNINISLAAAILATGPVAFSGNPVIISGTTYFNTTPYVGPTGGGALPISVSGHTHAYTDITNFGTGVANYVNTELSVSTGLRSDYNSNSNTLQFALSGQAANLHTLTGTGFVARTGGANNEGSFIARSIASGSNIDVLNGNAVNGNPTVSLASIVTGLTSLEATTVYGNTITPKTGQTTLSLGGKSVSITGDLTVGNLSVTGTTTTVNSTTITIQDPVITVGGTGTITSADAAFDRGIQLRYWNGSSAATGFMGLNSTTNDFIFLSSTTGTLTGNDYGAGTFGNARFGNLGSLGAISGNAIYATGQTASQLAVFDANKQIVSTGFPTITQLSYVSGVSSNIQTQLDSKASSGVSLTAGAGLTGGGSLTGNLSFNIGAGDGISVNTDDIAVNSTVVRTTGAQTISGIKTFANIPVFNSGLTSNIINATGFVGYGGGITGLYANNLSSGTIPIGVLSGTYNISITGNAGTVTSGVYTSGNQNIYGLKTFYDKPIFNSGLVSSGTFTVQSAASTTPVGFAVFDTAPTATGQSLLYRTINSVRTDLGSSTNTASTLVLRDSNGNFSAGSITGTSFIGSGNLLTDVNAYNLSIYSNTNTDTITSLVLVTGNSTGNYRPFIDSKLYFNASTNTLMLENVSGLLSGSYLSSSLNIIGATSISGTQGSPGNPVSQLLNFIVDGGTP